MSIIDFYEMEHMPPPLQVCEESELIKVQLKQLTRQLVELRSAQATTGQNTANVEVD